MKKQKIERIRNMVREYWQGRGNRKYDLGFYRVTIQKSKGMKQGYRFLYKTDTSLLKVTITSSTLLGLKKKVVKNNLYWGIEDKKKAFETCVKNKINPLLLNSNVNSHYVKHEFTFMDSVEYEKRI